MLRTLEATLDPQGKLHFREEVNLSQPQRVLVTLLEEHPAQEPGAGSVQALLGLLSSAAFRDRPAGSAAELEATVEQIRGALDE